MNRTRQTATCGATALIAAALATAVAPAAAIAAPHAAAHHANVTSLSASARHLGSDGGRVRLVAHTAHAAKCRFAVHGPSVSKTRTVSCRSVGSVDVPLPANSTAQAAHYRVSVVALKHGKYAASATRTLSISVAHADGSSLPPGPPPAPPGPPPGSGSGGPSQPPTPPGLPPAPTGESPVPPGQP